MTAPVISVRSASVAFDGRRVVSDVDLVVERGEVLAVLGANGSGKSTLVRAVLGLTPLADGSIELFGQPIARFREWKRVGYVPQRASAGSGVPATVREVVESGRLSRMRRLHRQSAGDRAAVTDALRTVGLADRAKDSVSTLSGGQQQRVLIARALACEPELLVLDEPTSGVDAHNQQALADAMARLVEREVTIVMVAHELGPTAPLVSRAVVMGAGRVLCDGPPPDAEHLHSHDPEHSHSLHAPEVRSLWGL
jgi:zinc transport system ATP-binding protein